jgi:hypothetical protein
VRPPNTSFRVGCRVNVKIVASIAHHSTRTRNAIHGRPDRK